MDPSNALKMGSSEIMVVAGEASGDLHASEVVAQLSQQRPWLRFFGMGGPKLGARFVDRIFEASEINVMGFTEVLPKLPRILQVMERLTQVAARRRPACALLVDIPDFNLRLAGRLKQLGIPVAYYISPTVWAWRQGRVKTIAQNVDKMLCILPFEPAFYKEHGVSAEYVGNPVVEQVPAKGSPAHFRRKLGLSPDRPCVALLPGSRGGELKRLLVPLLQAAKQLGTRRPELQFVLPVAPTVNRSALSAQVASQGVLVHLIEGQACEAVGASEVAVVASGTATLEAALMGRPLVVVYRMSAVNYAIGRALVKVPHVALPNLLLGERAVPELLQSQASPTRIAEAVEKLWPGKPAHNHTVAALERLHEVLGPNRASAVAAREILKIVDGE